MPHLFQFPEKLPYILFLVWFCIVTITTRKSKVII